MSTKRRSLEVDLRVYPGPRRAAVALGFFDALGPGEAMVITSDRDLKSILFQFQELRASSFDWSPLGDGRGEHRVEVRRRDQAVPRGVFEYLTWDHRRLDALLGDVRWRLEQQGCAAAAPRFADYRRGLERHIEMEEQILLPAFEQVTGIGGNPLAGICQEHVAIHRAVEEIAARLQTGDRGESLTLVDELRETLLLHDVKEERLFYPMSDELAGGDRERFDLVRWMQAM